MLFIIALMTLSQVEIDNYIKNIEIVNSNNLIEGDHSQHTWKTVPL